MVLTPTSPSGASDMKQHAVTPAARCMRAVFFLKLALIIYAISPTAAIGAQLVTNPPQAASAAAPTWAELSPVQQQALAPLAGEWDKLDDFRKKKWLEIGNRYAKMKPEQQQRMQERMRDWVKLTPEQRRLARESYARAKKLGPNKKHEHWQQYQQLPEEQKKKLAEDTASKSHIATLPSHAAQGKNGKTVPPIKSAPKRVIEKSVTPQAASVAPLQQESPATSAK